MKRVKRELLKSEIKKVAKEAGKGYDVTAWYTDGEVNTLNTMDFEVECFNPSNGDVKMVVLVATLDNRRNSFTLA